MSSKNNLLRLSGKIQHYKWGGYDFIPDLLDIPNPANQPFAEYWLGAHNSAPSEILLEEKKLLNDYIQEHPETLNIKVHERFKRLPYLLKVLDVKDMLSIQAHPSKEKAAVEFARENAEGILLSAANRNYKDDNHKPELMVALSDFWLLHGFKSAEKTIETIEAIPAFAFMLPLFKEGGHKKLYSHLMQMKQQEVDGILLPLLERIIPAYESGYLSKGSPHFWAARAALTFDNSDRIDRGIFSIYLLNLIHLHKGEAIFQDAGILHAYLEGQNIEIMANSDNVLRGGLTEKHIDVKELLKQVKFEGVSPAIIQAMVKENAEEVFESTIPDFRLSRFVLDKDGVGALHAFNMEIVLVTEGEVELKESKEAGLVLKKGEAALVLADTTVRIRAKSPAVLYRAKVNL